MLCTRCKTKTRCSHPKTDFTGTERTRICPKCGYRFPSVEFAKETFRKVELRHFEKRVREVLAEIKELVDSVSPVTPKGHS